jgi:hypothetical protein
MFKQNFCSNFVRTLLDSSTDDLTSKTSGKINKKFPNIVLYTIFSSSKIRQPKRIGLRSIRVRRGNFLQCTRCQICRQYDT